MKTLRYILCLLFIVIIALMVHGPKKLEPEYVRLGNLRHRLQTQLWLLSEIGECFYRQNLEGIQFDNGDTDLASCRILKGKGTCFRMEETSKFHYIIAPYEMNLPWAFKSAISLGMATLVDKVSDDIFLVGFTDGEKDVLVFDDMAYQAIIAGKGFACTFDLKSRCFRYLFPFDTECRLGLMIGW